MLGLGNDLTIVNPIERFPCLNLDGTDDYISIDHHSDLKPTAAISVSAWVNLDTMYGATGWVNPDTDDDDDHDEVVIGTIHVGGWKIGIQYHGTAANPTTKIYFEALVDDDGSGSAGYIKPIWGGISNAQLGATEHEIKDFSGWVHIAATFRAGIATLYINGSNDLYNGEVDTSDDQIVNTGVSGAVLQYANNTMIMIGADAGHATNNVAADILRGGLVAEVAIWNAGISAAGILQIYNKGYPGLDLTTNIGNYLASGTLKGYWKFNEKNANDSSGNGYNGNLNNSPSFIAI